MPEQLPGYFQEHVPRNPLEQLPAYFQEQLPEPSVRLQMDAINEPWLYWGYWLKAHGSARGGSWDAGYMHAGGTCGHGAHCGHADACHTAEELAHVEDVGEVACLKGHCSLMRALAEMQKQHSAARAAAAAALGGVDEARIAEDHAARARLKEEAAAVHALQEEVAEVTCTRCSAAASAPLRCRFVGKHALCSRKDKL